MGGTGDKQTRLSGRERQVLDLIHALAPVSAGAIRERMQDAPTDSAVRSILRSLTKRGVIRVEREGKRYLYRPSEPRGKSGKKALSHTVQTFFEGSVASAVSALLESAPSHDELERIKAMVEEATRREGKGGP